jgi:hypothetical protein
MVGYPNNQKIWNDDKVEFSGFVLANCRWVNLNLNLNLTGPVTSFPADAFILPGSLSVCSKPFNWM